MKFLSALRKKKVPRDFYLSLIFKPHKVAAILFEKTQDSLVIISTKEELLATQLDQLTGDDLVRVSDIVISSVEGALPEGEMVENTIFSVPYSWQQEGKISRENLSKLKKICDALELKAIGFIISVEAIVNFLHKKEGAPVSAIFVEHAADQAIMYLVKGGSIVEVSSADAGEDFVETVEKLLSKVENVSNLPAKIILHDYEGVDSLQQKFLNHEWKKELNFLQIPQVLVLEKGFENEAVIHGVASQMGFDVLQNLQAGAQIIDEENEDLDPEYENIEVASAEEFGFTQGDAPVEPEEEGNADTQHIQEDDESEEENTDNVPDQDEKSESFSLEHANVQIPDSQDTPDLGNDEREEKLYKDVEEEKKDTLDTRTTLVDKLTSIKIIGIISALKTKGGFSSVLKQGFNLRIGIIAFAAIAVLVLGTYIYYSYVLKAEVIIFADSTVVNEENDVTFSSEDSTSFDDKTITLGTIVESVDVSAQKDASGTKETGEKAKGEVVIYNKTEKPVSFEKGTEITANNLDFVLLSDVKIASTSSFSTSFSNSKVKVEAQTFGKEANLPSGTNFTVDGASTGSYFARNESAFSGGTKTELTVVSKADIEKLRSDAQKGTEQKALEAARKEINNSTLLINTPLSTDMDEEKFSKKEGEEAKNVSLSGKINYTFGTYDKDDITEFVEQMASGRVPQDYSFHKDQSDIQVTDISVKDEVVTGKISVNAVFLPTIETENILSEIRGKKVKNAEKVIHEKKGISDITIKRKNVLPLFPGFLPFNEKNITITVKTNG